MGMSLLFAFARLERLNYTLEEENLRATRTPYILLNASFLNNLPKGPFERENNEK